MRRSRPRATLAVFAALMLATHIGLALAIAAGRADPHDHLYAMKANLCRAHLADAGPTRVLALGSSRTMLGFDPHAFVQQCRRPTSAFNFGIPAAGPLVERLYYRRLTQVGVTAEVVLIEVLPPFLAGQCERPYETIWLRPHRLRADEWPLAVAAGFDLGTADPDGWRKRLTPWYAHRTGLLENVWRGGLPERQRSLVGEFDAAGWVNGRTRMEPTSWTAGVAAAWAQHGHVLPGYRCGGPALATLAGLVADVRAAGASPVVVLMPEGDTFRGWYPAAAYAELPTVLAALGAPVIDARTWLGEEAFSDSHHLTPAGAAAYSTRLAAELFPGGCR